MTEIYSGGETKAIAKFCPSCGSADLALGPIEVFTWGEGSKTRCICGWSGTTGDLVMAPFTHGMGSDEQLLQTMMNDLRNVLAKKFAESFGMFLLKWGFITREVTPQEFSRYVVAVAKQTLRAVIETRQEIEREQHGGS